MFLSFSGSPTSLPARSRGSSRGMVPDLHPESRASPLSPDPPVTNLPIIIPTEDRSGAASRAGRPRNPLRQGFAGQERGRSMRETCPTYFGKVSMSPIPDSMSELIEGRVLNVEWPATTGAANFKCENVSPKALRFRIQPRDHPGGGLRHINPPSFADMPHDDHCKCAGVNT